jgi:hypothetical protein
MTATRAPIPPATRAAACVGRAAAKFDVDELAELEDLLDELLPDADPPYVGVGLELVPYGLVTELELELEDVPVG